jgi:hypothetical protein
VLKKSFFLADQRNFLGPLMRFAFGDVRDHIVSHKSDQGASCGRYAVLQWRSRPKISFCKIFGVVQFSTFATLSTHNGLWPPARETTRVWALCGPGRANIECHPAFSCIVRFNRGDKNMHMLRSSRCCLGRRFSRSGASAQSSAVSAIGIDPVGPVPVGDRRDSQVRLGPAGSK